MVELLYIFQPVFNNDELEGDFNNFFYSNNLIALFTNEHRAGTITYTYTDARSVINEKGRYAKDLKTFSDILSTAVDNKSYEEAIFKVIYNVSTFQKFMVNVRKIIRGYASVDNEHLFNFWNIVFYTKEII